MRYAAKGDGNHRAVADALESVPGVLVLDTRTLGGGAPDLLVGFRGRLVMLEIKDGSLSPSRKKLNGLQVVFHRKWQGYVFRVESITEALAAIGVK